MIIESARFQTDWERKQRRDGKNLYKFQIFTVEVFMQKFKI